jgi:type II secretory pathway pseudopilin PulG
MMLHRGLILLEVLIATALLAMMAAACMPVMAQAMRALQIDEPPRSIEMINLAHFADSVLAHPESFGFEQQSDVLNADNMELPWPAEAVTTKSASVPPVRITALRGADPEVDHAWLAFECDGLVVHRWLAVPGSEETAKP